MVEAELRDMGARFWKNAEPLDPALSEIHYPLDSVPFWAELCFCGLHLRSPKDTKIRRTRHSVLTGDLSPLTVRAWSATSEDRTRRWAWIGLDTS